MEVIVSRYTRPIVLSSVIVDNELRPAKFCCNGQTENIDSISHSWLEEADERLILHVGWAVEEKRCERVIVVSNDTPWNNINSSVIIVSLDFATMQFE